MSLATSKLPALEISPALVEIFEFLSAPRPKDFVISELFCAAELLCVGEAFVRIPAVSTFLALCMCTLSPSATSVFFKSAACIDSLLSLFSCASAYLSLLFAIVSALTVVLVPFKKLMPIKTLAKPTLSLRKL